MKFEDIKKANESIKTTDIKGKDYAEVNQRIKAFKMLYPEGFIKTEIQSLENGICLMRAVVGFYEGEREVVLATGTAYEKEGSTFINKTSYIENCETSAVGRALGMAGIGIDVSVASAEEVQNAMAQQEATKRDSLITKIQAESLKETIKKNPDKLSEEAILKRYRVDSLAKLKTSQLREIIEYLNGGKK